HFAWPLRVGPIRTKLEPTLTSLMRRRPELIELATLLSRARMVTLTDPGDVGKSWLAFGSRLRGWRKLCGWSLVDLAAVSDAASVWRRHCVIAGYAHPRQLRASPCRAAPLGRSAKPDLHVFF